MSENEDFSNIGQPEETSIERLQRVQAQLTMPYRIPLVDGVTILTDGFNREICVLEFNQETGVLEVRPQKATIQTTTFYHPIK